MRENFLKSLPPEEKRRFNYIEDRPELFETKIFRIPTPHEAPNEKKLLVATRDAGSGNALLPVIKELMSDPGLDMDIVTDGRAQEIIQKNFQVEDVTPEGMVLEADRVIKNPKAILMDRSTETGLDSYVSATFPEVPKVLVEDYYTNTVDFLAKLIKHEIPLPEKICVMDKVAKELILERFPQLEKRIEITGQPAFDKFTHEDRERLTREVKQKLGLQPTDKIVSFMSTVETPEKIKVLAEALKGMAGDFYFAFRRHPSDNTSYEAYEKALTDEGIRVVDTNKLPTNEIGAASDVVLTTWSTEGLHGIYRRKPTAHITDPNFSALEGMDLPLPPVRLGASAGVNNIHELAETLPQLLDPASDLNKKLRKNMEENYPADGKNAERVASIVREYLS